MAKYIWIEEYHCGCAAEERRKRDLLGYCATHGEDAIRVYKMPYEVWKAAEDAIEREEKEHASVQLQGQIC